MATEEDRSELSLSRDSFDVACSTCNNKNLKEPAISYCIDCNKNFCEKCLKVHDEYIEGHTLVDMSDEDQGSLLTEKCEKHKEEVINLFCVDHDDVICSVCSVLNHGKNHDHKLIADYIEDLEKDPRIQLVPEQLQSALKGVEQVITEVDKHLETLSECELKLLKEIEEYTTKILDKIKEMKGKAENDITTKHEHLTSLANEKRQTCMVIKENIIKKLEVMEVSKRRKANLFVLKKKGQSLIKNTEKICWESEDMMRGSRLAFRPERRIEACLNDLTSLVTDFTVDRKYSATLKGSADITVEGGKEELSDIHGCCVLRDGTVLFVDDSDKKLKHFEPSNCTVKDQCELMDTAMGIASLSPEEVAVATMTPDLQIVSLGTKLACNSTLPLNHDCRILVQSRGELFVADKDTVYVHEVNGKLLRTISQETIRQSFLNRMWELSRRKVPWDIRGLAVNSTGDMVYIAVLYRGLICVDREGQEMFRRSEEELGLAGADGLCTDNAGNVFVCGWLSHNVVQVSEDGKVHGEILSKSHGIDNPRCLSFDQETNTLYVGGWTSKLLMFELK